jgi:hypothetical protein
LDVKDLEFSTRRKEPWFQSTFKPRHASQCLSNINRSCFFCLCGITSFSLEKDKHYRDSSRKQNAIKRKADIITSSKINNLSSSLQVPVPLKKNLCEIWQHSLEAMIEYCLIRMRKSRFLNHLVSERCLSLKRRLHGPTKKVVHFFQVGDFTVRSAHALKENCGILATPKPKKLGQTLSEQHKEIIA